MSSASGRPPAAIPPKRRDSSTAVWWILGIVAGGIVVMVVFGLALAGMLIHNLHVHNQGQNVEIQTPVGGIKVGHEATVNLPVYPGSTSASSHDNANVELSAGDEGFALAVENYQATDDLDKVSAWYAQRLGPSFRREKKGSHTKIKGVDANSDADVAFVDDRGDGARVVALTNKDNCVEIALVRVGKKETQ
ncbi:MAG: hypothetical protein WAL95_02545 [Candidatus Acidiferrales bacterium]